MDEGFIGFSSARPDPRQQLLKKTVLGVGRYDSRHQPSAFTTSHRDFHKGIAESLNVPLQNLSQPAVFVIKKNSEHASESDRLAEDPQFAAGN